VASTILFDGTPATANAPSLAGLVPEAVAAVNPSDLDRLGLHAGDLVRLKSATGQLELPAVPDASVARGAVVVASRTKTHLNEAVANVVATLVDATALVTDVRMESR
jgi:anaerobic selenocysteine-containing dehydrogenase